MMIFMKTGRSFQQKFIKNVDKSRKDKLIWKGVILWLYLLPKIYIAGWSNW
jgi:hypothetical protein